TLASITAEYLKREGSKLRTLRQRESVFRRQIFPALGARAITEIGRRDVVKMLDKVEDDSGPRAADEALAAVARLFNWHAARDDVFRSPIVRGMRRARPASERARTRILTDDELRRVWRAAEEMGYPFGRLVQFLLLTAARRTEASAMRWSELSGLDWT